MRLIPPFLLGAIVLVGACGPVPYQPVEMLHPAPGADSLVTFGALHLGLRAGPRWLEVRLNNTGEEPIEVDWSQAGFQVGGRNAHRVISSAWLSHLTSASGVDPGGDAHDRGPVWAYHPVPFDMDRRHEIPPELERAPREPPLLLKAGRSVVSVLYPAEHMYRRGYGVSAHTPLLCVHEPGGAEHQTFWLYIPVRVGDSSDVLRVHGRLEVVDD
jgi:hypothetical protein